MAAAATSTVRFAAFLRGINVGGNKKVAMADLRALLEGLGYEDVATLLQSGNAVFTGPKQKTSAVEVAIGEAIEAELGMDVSVLVRTADELAAVVDGNPFLATASDVKHLHALFVDRNPTKTELVPFDPADHRGEDLAVGDRVVYLHLPNGVADATLPPVMFAKGTKILTTQRTWNTVTKVLTKARS